MLRRGRNREEADISEQGDKVNQAIAARERGCQYLGRYRARTVVPLPMIPILDVVSIVYDKKNRSILGSQSNIAVNPYNLAIYGEAGEAVQIRRLSVLVF